MKILSQKNLRGSHFARRNENGMATIMFISLLTIMVLLAAAESASLIRLHREVKFLEQQQIKRLNGQQNSFVSAAPAITNSNSK
jgi:hypothetical protein